MDITKNSFSNNARNIILTTVWFGLITGIVEGITLLVLKKYEFLFWRLTNRAIWYETLWISPIFDLLLFLLIGVAFVILARITNRTWVHKLLVFVLIFLAIFDWLYIVLAGRISIIALIVLTAGLSLQLSRWFFKYEKSVDVFIRTSTLWLGTIIILIFIVLQGGNWLLEKTAISNLAKSDGSKPNVLLIVADTLRADHLGSYGYSRSTSPNIDRLAQEGVVFDSAIAPSSWTQPTHASILTGLYTYQHNAELHPLTKEYRTLPEVLYENGYMTGAFSANLLFFTRRQGFGRGFLRFEDNFHTIADMAANTLYGYLFDYYVLRKVIKYEGVISRKLAEDINQSALRWIDKNPDKSFFLMLNYFDVHDPYLPPQPYRNYYSQIENPGGLINSYLERLYPEMTDDQLQSEIDAYDGAINYVDDQIGVLLEELQKRGILENTIVVFTSDHGESFGEHGLLQHSASLYIQEIHVPLIIWWPGKVPSGTRVEFPISISAIEGTIMELTNIGNQSSDESKSLVPLWENTNGPPKEFKYPISEIAQFPGASPQNPSTHGAMKAVLSEDWHYISHEQFGVEVYDRASDPHENLNLANDTEMKFIIDGFQSFLNKLTLNAISLSR